MARTVLMHAPVTASRIIVPGATTAITKRCNQRKAFLAPWHPEVTSIWLYVLARGQELYRVAVHHGQLAINHEHLEVTPEQANLCEFMTYCHRELSKALNTLLAHENYDAPHELLDSRKPHYMRLMDPAAQLTRLVYDDLNCVSAGLVARPEHMPGRVLTIDLWRTGYVDVPKPSVYFGRHEPDVRRLYVTPPPLLYRAFQGDIDKLVYHIERIEEEGIRAIRATQKRAPMGARAVTLIHPWSEPKTLRTDSGQPNRTFAWGARDAITSEHRRKSAKEVRGFRRSRHECFEAFRSGDHEVVFPYGTYAMVRAYGARMQPECEPDALVTRPGPTLDDVKAELAGQRFDNTISDEAIALLTETRDAIREDAERMSKEEALDLASKKEASAQASHSRPKHADTPARGAVVRHRFDCQVPAGAASRVVTLRDKRRGRPKKQGRPGSRDGADPPD